MLLCPELFLYHLCANAMFTYYAWKPSKHNISLDRCFGRIDPCIKVLYMRKIKDRYFLFFLPLQVAQKQYAQSMKQEMKQEIFVR